MVRIADLLKRNPVCRIVQQHAALCQDLRCPDLLKKLEPAAAAPKAKGGK